ELAIEGEPVEPVDVGGIDDPVEGAVKAVERVEIAFAAVDQIGATLAAGAGGGSYDEDVREAVAVHVPGRRDVPAELDKHAGPENVAVHPVDAGEINRMRKLSHERSPPLSVRTCSSGYAQNAILAEFRDTHYPDECVAATVYSAACPLLSNRRSRTSN